uniref:Isopentenyl phosphate kinase n=1 Tax=Arion vulgaris TaxID=1028688 RepID=A0A0B7A0G1_9EUPU
MASSVTHQVVDVVIKFGGSAITDKDSLETLRPDNLLLSAHCIRQCKDAGLSCIVVHGAGSFGHHQAREYQINSGLVGTNTKEERDKKMWGFCVTRQSVTKLNQLVVNSLIEAGVPAISCSPGGSWSTEKRQPTNWPNSVVAQHLRLGLVPVFHGDCSQDSVLGCCILSGDTIIKTLCSYFDVRRVIFFTDVAGIYDMPPDRPGAQLLKTIQVNQDGSIKDLISTSQSRNDVTGGILLKLTTAIDIVVQSKGKTVVHVCAVDSTDAAKICLGAEESGNHNFTTVSLDGF